MVTVTQNQRLYNFMKINRCSIYRGYGTLRKSNRFPGFVTYGDIREVKKGFLMPTNSIFSFFLFSPNCWQAGVSFPFHKSSQP